MSRSDEYKTIDFKEILAKMDPERRAQIEEGAAELAKEYELLEYLRQELKLSPEGLSETLALPLEEVIRMTRQADVLLVAMQNSIAAAGGRISLLVEMPDKKPIRLDEIADIIDLQSDR